MPITTEEVTRAGQPILDLIAELRNQITSTHILDLQDFRAKFDQLEKNATGFIDEVSHAVKG